jgi:hypothetical protein
MSRYPLPDINGKNKKLLIISFQALAGSLADASAGDMAAKVRQSTELKRACPSVKRLESIKVQIGILGQQTSSKWLPKRQNRPRVVKN